MPPRFHLTTCLVVLANALLLLLLYCSLKERSSPVRVESPAPTLQPFQCLVEGSRKLQCVKDAAGEVYLPFNSFIKKQFDVTGRLTQDAFEYYTSYAKVRVPDSRGYDPKGPFGMFTSYNVEIRDRVKCISAESGVPLSVQWDSTPYAYPIQIAQYALQHYSRNKTAPPPTIKLLRPSPPTNDGVLSFEGVSVRVKLAAEGAPVLLFRWRAHSPSASFSIRLEELKSVRQILLKYQHTAGGGGEERRCVWAEEAYYDEKGNNGGAHTFVYSLGVANISNTNLIVLDLVVEATKALALLQPPHSSSPIKETEHSFLKGSDIRPLELTFHGAGEVELPLRQQSQAHHEMFTRAANWLLNNQDVMGGWPVPVQRTIAEDRLVLQKGWHSAMAQGHALSVLSRAYHSISVDDPSARERLLNSSRRALELLRLDASEGGIVNRLFNWTWYEEYPTTPTPTFVLNGFLYSLIGLWDAASIPQLRNESMALFEKGMASLRELLPLYDTGSGSLYDLRHLGLRTAPNLARWDYHAVHIYQLRFISHSLVEVMSINSRWIFDLTGDTYFREVADRWIGYAHGRRAKHN